MGAFPPTLARCPGPRLALPLRVSNPHALPLSTLMNYRKPTGTPVFGAGGSFRSIIQTTRVHARCSEIWNGRPERWSCGVKTTLSGAREAL